MTTNFIEFNKQSVAKQYGSGDCVHSASKSKTPNRTPVPSSRRFNPYTKRDETLPQKLEEAIKELTQPQLSSVPTTSLATAGPFGYKKRSARRNLMAASQRKRSLTMSEITPTKSTDETKRPNRRLRADGEASSSTASSRVLHSGRRVFQLLLLNAWRRRREQVASLTESSAEQETLVNRLTMQLDAVHSLRIHESDRRDAAELSLKRCEENLAQCHQDFATLEENAKSKIEQLENLLYLEQQENDRLLGEKKVQETSHLEKIKNGQLRLEICNEEIAELKQVAKRFQEESEKNMGALQDTISERDGLVVIINKLEERADSLEIDVNSLRTERPITHQVLKEMQRKLEHCKIENAILNQQNEEKTKTIEELREALSKLERRTWWEKVEELGLTPMEILRFAVLTIMPSIL